MRGAADPFHAWFEALEARHLSRLTFAEVRRGPQALSALYVDRGSRLGSGAALEGAGKRAAFALFYAPLHFLVVRRVVEALGAANGGPKRLLDLGCGTGSAGAAWAGLASRQFEISGVDRSGWAVEEARWTYRALGLRGEALRGDLRRTPLPGRGCAILAAYTVNEIDDAARAALLPRLLEAARRGARVLVVEPIARRPFPWWEDWLEAFRAAGGRDDVWRFPADLPERLRLLDRAARLDHRELTARSLWLG